MKSLTQARQFLADAIQDVQHDLSTDWIKEDDKRKMQIQLQMLIVAKGNLDALALNGEACQIFKSSIKF
jgi:hypothetical protein